MASENDKYKHNRVENTALAYVSNASVTESRPHWIAGSHDTLSSIRGWTERRPGFIPYTADSFPHPIQRWFTWQRWDGSFFVMASGVDVAGTNSNIYKYEVGIDSTFSIVVTSGTTNPFDFVEANNHVYCGNGSSMVKYDGTTLTLWGVSKPVSVPTAAINTTGLVPATIGHRYVYAYGVAATGYVSDISDPSDPITTPLKKWDVTGARSVDTQVDEVHIYRTEDGGSVYLELSNSPIANPGSGTWTITDNDADTSLQQSSPAPFPGVNGRPPALRGLRYFAGRIWGYKGDTVYFSTFEENTTSVPEECFGQPLTNSFSFGAQVLGLGVTPDRLLVFTARGIYCVGGDSLNTFTRTTLSKTMGVRNSQCIAEHDGKLSWLDISNTVAQTDGYTITQDDVSLPIRPDIESIVHAQASMTAYITGKYKWLLLCDGAASKIRVFDLNMNQWNPPWNITSMTSIGVGQVAAGSWKLFLARGNKPLVIDHATFADDSAAYTAELYTNLMKVNPDNAISSGALEFLVIERNALPLFDVGYLTDEDPEGATYTSIFPNEIEPVNRTNGSNLVEKWYGANYPAAQRVSGYLKWAAEATKFILYTLDIVYTKVN